MNLNPLYQIAFAPLLAENATGPVTIRRITRAVGHSDEHIQNQEKTLRDHPRCEVSIQTLGGVWQSYASLAVSESMAAELTENGVEVVWS